MNGGRSWLLRCVLVLSTVLPAWAQGPQTGGGEDRSPHSDVELVSEGAWVQPGRPFTVAVRLRMDDAWHSYWKNPGDSGDATYVEWDLPPGFAAGEIQWPFPHRIDLGPLTSYGYSDEVLLLTEIAAPDTLRPGTTVTLEGRAFWLICAEICLLAEGDLRLTLPVRAEAPAPGPAYDAVAAARAALPAEPEGWDVRATRSGGTYALRLVPPDGRRLTMEGATFFPMETSVLDHAAPQPVSREGDAYLIALQRSEYAQASVERLQGVLVAPEGHAWDAAGRVRALAVDVPVEDARDAGIAAGGAAASTTLLWALVLAFAGGLLLNLMPCVFPILSIKILGFARQREDADAEIRRHGLLFGAGVLVSFWVLAGVLLALRAGGSQIGWGFQLQSPAFIALMALLFFGIGLSLLGVFEVGMGLMRWGGRMERSAGAQGAGGAFLSGVLATVVATPCTAPFMGAALGVALTLSAADALLVFTALGAGMALPYVALSMTPQLLKRLPKPGAWMETLKHVLAFPMLATTVWLVWVFGRQVGVDGVAMLLFGLLLLGAAAWIVGRWAPGRVSTRARVASRSVAALGVAGAVALCVIGTRFEAPVAAGGAPGDDAAWQPYAAETVERLRAEGRPVFIDFTAAWCLTCQVNKRTTLRTDAVQRAFAEKRVALLTADWTNQDPAVTRALEALGRSGVPVYALYPGDGSGPVLLPEILTRDLVLDALDDLPAPIPVAATTVAR